MEHIHGPFVRLSGCFCAQMIAAFGEEDNTCEAWFNSNGANRAPEPEPQFESSGTGTANAAAIRGSRCTLAPVACTAERRQRAHQTGSRLWNGSDFFGFLFKRDDAASAATQRSAPAAGPGHRANPGSRRR